MMAATLNQKIQDCINKGFSQNQCTKAFEQAANTKDTCVAFYMLENPTADVKQTTDKCNQERANAALTAAAAYGAYQIAPVVASNLATALRIANVADDTATAIACARGNQSACAYILPAIANPIPGMSLASQYADDLAALFKPVANFFDDLASLRNLPDANNPAGWGLGTYGGQTAISANNLLPSPDGSYRQALYEWEEDMLAYEARYLNLNKRVNEGTLPYGLPTHEEILEMASSDTLKGLTPEGIRRSLYGINPHTTSSQRYLTDNPRIGYEIALTQQRLGTPNLTCLDVGCSSGIAANTLQQAMPELQITGVDVVNQLEVNLPFIQTAGHNLQLPTESVDVVIAANMMGYLPADYIEGALLPELQRVLRPGGLFVGGMDWWTGGFSSAPKPELFYFIKP